MAHSTGRAPQRIAVLGEGLIELCGTVFGALRQGPGGDTLNTAVYLARLARDAIEVRYVTVVGVDHLSGALVDLWHVEGINTDLVLRDPNRGVGLYQVHVDAAGERTFTYWRSASAARYLLQHPEFDRVSRSLSDVSMIVLSGISLAILPDNDRGRLIARLAELADSGILIGFDTNYRASLWEGKEQARDRIGALLPFVHLMLTSFDDEQHLWGDTTPEETIARLHASGVPNVVVKLGGAGVCYSTHGGGGRLAAQPVERVVDTTAAGDAFNAAFIAAYQRTGDMQASCLAGGALARVVIAHPGKRAPAADVTN